MVSDEQRKRSLARGVQRDPKRPQLLLFEGLAADASEPDVRLRRARAIAHVLDRYPVVHECGERIVGRFDTQRLSPEEERRLEKAYAHVDATYPRLRFGHTNGGVGGHRTIDFSSLLTHGVDGILAEIDRCDDDGVDIEAQNFYAASRIVLSGLLRFAGRYRQMMAGEPVAEILSRVPARPPQSFHEALQSVWFVQFALSLADDTTCTGRPDNYLWAFYKRDRADGTLLRDGALALIEEFYLRSNEAYGRWPETIMLGGCDSDGAPVLNELSELFLEAVDTVGLINPNVAVCYREDMPDEFLLKGLEILGNGRSHPAFYNDRIVTEGLEVAGLTAEDARQYNNSTCVEITPVGTSNVQVVAAKIYAAKTLTTMLKEEGEASVAGLDLSEMASFEEFYTAYKTALSRSIATSIDAAMHVEEMRMRHGSNPLVSCFTADCIARGRDAARGGARYNYCGTITAGFSTTVDSLLAIRYAAFDEKLMTLAKLAEIVSANFEGEEALRRRICCRAPKYGNDDPKADALAVDLYDFICNELSRYRSPLGGGFFIGVFSGWGRNAEPEGAHISFGRETGATPDGRLSGEPLSECIGPAAGADHAGLTALIHSVTRTDHRRGLGGISVNCRVQQGVLKSEEGRKKMLALLRVFMARGGAELQFNVVDSDTLRDAQRDPEAYPGLTVRIAGYSDYFNRLSRTQQDELIGRTEYSLTPDN
jgi:pyruvate-formate lyase